MMMVVVAYDVKTSDPQGVRRLRRVAKQCLNYGQRAQNSVFECLIDETNFQKLKLELLAIIDERQDSLRFYRLGNHYQGKIEVYGAKQTLALDEPLII